MFDRLAEAKGALEEVVASLDAETLDGATATQLVEEFAAIERLAVAGKALCAKRVADSGAWRRDGDRSPAPGWRARPVPRSATPSGFWRPPSALQSFRQPRRLKNLLLAISVEEGPT